MGHRETIAGVGEIDADPNAELLIEVPHGATERRHYEDLRRQLRSPLAANLIDFFFVNTDIGAPEAAALLAQLIRAAGMPVTMLRSWIPRTFVDCNRELYADPADLKRGGFTAAIPSYVTEEADRVLLAGLHGQYTALADLLQEEVCGNGGKAILLHTYAPRTVGVEVDADIGAAIRRAYEPGNWEKWAERPDVEVITKTPEGEDFSPRELIADLQARYRKIGIELAENATYQMHSGTLGHRYSSRYPGRVLCIELNREKLGDPWQPFAETRMHEGRLRDRVAVLAQAILEARARP